MDKECINNRSNNTLIKSHFLSNKIDNKDVKICVNGYVSQIPMTSKNLGRVRRNIGVKNSGSAYTRIVAFLLSPIA